jgi:hypothetical protein
VGGWPQAQCLETPTPDIESELRSPRTPQGGAEQVLLPRSHVEQHFSASLGVGNRFLDTADRIGRGNRDL